MSSVTNLLRTTVLLSIVTTVVASWDTAPKSNNSSTLIKRQPVIRDVGENFDKNSRRVFYGNRKIRTNFEDVKITQKLLANNDKQHHDYFSPNFHPQNVFKCPPCVCKNISLNSVSVFCKKCSFTSIPQSWPFEIDEIIIKDCDKLEVLDLKTLLMYTSLTRLEIMTDNLCKVFSSSKLNVSSTMLDLDFTSSGISTVQKNSYLVFPNLLKLSLRENQLENLTKEMFTGLHNLRYLSVAGNKISFIANDTFDDMGNLVTLDISYNEMIYTDYDPLPVRIFIPLKNLQQLYINDICEYDASLCGSYPNEALQVLTNLRLLSIDRLDSHGLGPEIKSLVHLNSLIITYPESYTFFDESYFDNVPSITTLVFEYFLVQNIPPKAFGKLKNLVNLIYTTHNGYGDLCKFLKDIKYLPNSSLNYLKLSKVNGRETGCKELNAQQAVHLKLFNLVELDLSDNFLVYLSPDFIAMLPKTLNKIDLSRNNLSSSLYFSFDMFPKELLEINLEHQLIFHDALQNEEDINKRLKEKTKLQSNNSLISNLKSTVHQTVDKLKVSKGILPPKLKNLQADHFRNFLNYKRWDKLNCYFNCSLKILSLADCDFRSWSELYFFDSVEMADFSKNNAEFYNPHFFPKNNSLKYLKMSNNLFGLWAKYHLENLFFGNTKKLIALDMSKNSIKAIPNGQYGNLSKLQILDISENQLQMINFSLSSMTELRFLNLSRNSITSISKQSRDDLDIISADHRVYLDLTFNPLPFTCKGLELMKWMAFTNVYLLNQDFLVCINEFDEVIEIGDIVQRVETLQHQCGSKTVIILTCVFSIIVIGILLIASLMYRYRWKLRYYRRIGLVKLLGTRPAANIMIRYRFDAYILYTDDTRKFVLRDCVRELEEKRGHRLCIEERDFLPGTYIVTNIVSGVQNSAKTVAMVTPEFYEGEFSEYSIKMALMEEIFMRRSVLFLCVCERINDDDLSDDLLTAMKQNNYIEYPPRDDVTDEIIDEFWNLFSRAIGRNDQEEI